MLPDVSRERLLEMHRRMLVIRRFEEALIELTADYDVGHFHVSIGQEVTGVVALELWEEGDVVFTTHRNHGHLLARGADSGKMLAEILGKATGYNRGKGGTLHLASLELGFPTTSSATGGCVPLAVGAGFGFSRRKVPNVSICAFGDGALEEGAWHEAVNIAALEKLPVIFLVENNSLDAVGQRNNEYPSSTLAATDLCDLARPFRIPTIAIDGLDARAVNEAMEAAVKRARAGEGPSFIEARTVRWPGSKPLWPELRTGRTQLEMAWGAAPTDGEYKKWFDQEDGVLIFTRELIDAGHMTSEEVLAVDAKVVADVAAGVRFALDSPYPEASEALTQVFAGGAA